MALERKAMGTAEAKTAKREPPSQPERLGHLVFPG